MFRTLGTLTLTLFFACSVHAVEVAKLKGSWVTRFEQTLPSRSNASSPPRISLVSQTRFDESGNAISIVSSAVENKIRNSYEPLVSYVLAEQGKWTKLSDKTVSVETIRCTLMQTDQLPDQGAIPQLRTIVRNVILESCKSKPEVFEIVSLTKDSIVVRQDGVTFEMKRAAHDE